MRVKLSDKKSSTAVICANPPPLCPQRSLMRLHSRFLGKASCSKNSSVKALRCQLPRENAFYPYEPDVGIAATAALGTQVRGWAVKCIF